MSNVIQYVIKKHKGQLDKCGNDYFTAHLLDVADIVRSLSPIQVTPLINIAFGHDLLEDTDATSEEMRENGFSEHEIRCIEQLTKFPNEPNDLYIQRITEEDAKVVKIADITSNLGRLDKLDDATKDRLKKRYFKNLKLLAQIA